MPKITIYVPDELKARMEKAEALDPAPNWSAVAQQVFERECDIAANRKKGAGRMNAMIERLQKSKDRKASQDKVSGHAAGRGWAQKSAEYDELERISNVDLEGYFSGEPVAPNTRAGWLWVEITGGEDDRPNNEDIEAMFGHADPSDEYLGAFVDGAIEAFREVEDKL